MGGSLCRAFVFELMFYLLEVNSAIRAARGKLPPTGYGVVLYLWAGLYAALLFWVKFAPGNTLRAARGKLPPTGYGARFICRRGFMPRFYV